MHPTSAVVGGRPDRRRAAEGARVPASLANDADLAAVGEGVWRGPGTRRRRLRHDLDRVGAGVLLGSMPCARPALDRRARAHHHRLPEPPRDGGRSGLRHRSNALAKEAGWPPRVLSSTGSSSKAITRPPTSGIEFSRRPGGAANLAHLFSPEIVVVGGVWASPYTVLEAVRVGLERFGPKHLPDPIEVTHAELGDDSGLVGAAFWGQAAPRTWN